NYIALYFFLFCILLICPLFNLIFKSDGSIQWAHMMTRRKLKYIETFISKPGKKMIVSMKDLV
ncbi:MAG: hypothetical protein ACXWFZ_08165, partial [Nitrososphaeraceae archaeon]